MKTRALFSCPEALEARIAPATLDVVSGVLTYTAGAAVNNSLTLSLSSGSYSFNDTSETITLGTGATNAGFTGGGTNTVTGPDGAVNSINVLLGDQGDQMAVSGLADPLAVDGQAGTDSVFFTGATNVGGALVVAADSVVVNVAMSGATSVSFTADTVGINAAVEASASVLIAPQTAGRLLNLGTETAGRLSLTATELGRFTAPKLTLGSADAGSIAISAALALTNVSVLSLITGGGITQTGTIAVDALAIAADTTVALGGANDVNTLAGLVSVQMEDFSFTDTDGFQIGTVDGRSGLFVSGQAGSVLTLEAGGAVTQAIGAAVGGQGLQLLGAGSFNLQNTANSFSALAANTTGQINYTDANALTISSVGPTQGITSTNGSVSITTRAGSLTVVNANGSAAADIDAGSGFVSLSAGAAGADHAILLSANAGVSAMAGVIFTADNMSLGGAVNAGTASVTLRPFEDATTLDLGGADAAGVLGITDVEMDFITTGHLQIGDSSNPSATISAALTPGGTNTLSLLAGTITGAGSVVVPTFSFRTSGAFSLTGANDVNTLHGAVGTGPITFEDVDGFAVGGALPPNASAFALLSDDPTQRTLDAGSGTVSFANTNNPFFALNGATPGTQHDQWTVSGGVNLTGASLSLNATFTPVAGTEIVLIRNDGTDAVVGAFSNRAEGDLINVGGRNFFISYRGGDGNDVTLTVPEPLAVTVAPGGKSATFTDVDGDLVTVKTTKGVFDGSEFTGIETGANDAGQLQRLALDADFAGTNLTITAKRGPNGGNGFVNVGFFDASGVDLGTVSLAGDLGRLSAGTAGGDAKVPGLKSLTVQSLGLLGTSTQGGSGGIGLTVQGTLPKLVVKDDLRAGINLFGATDGRLGSATIGGSIVGVTNITLSAQAGIGVLKIGGDIRATSNGSVSFTSFSGAFGAVTVGGSILGVSETRAVNFSAFGQLTAPAKGLDLALKSLTVKGSVEHLSIFAGGVTNPNADASIGSISVGGDWIASNVFAGAGVGADFTFGTADDTKVTVPFPGARDAAARFSTIGSFTVKGQALGTSTTSDMFGIVAERIGKAKVGTRTFAFTSGATPEAFFAAPTFDGEGAENPAFDFTIREIGSTTPTPAFGGSQLDISSDGKTATFTDVDGDKVTVKRSAGVFLAGDFTITDNAVGGGQLERLTLTAAPGDARFNLSITAKPGPDGGNGFVNIGTLGNITGPNVLLGTVKVGGDLGLIDVGVDGSGQPGVTALTMHSFRALGFSTGAAGNSSTLTGGAGSITVESDARDGAIGVAGVGAKLGVLKIGGAFVNVSFTAEDGIGSVKIGGSMRGGRISTDGPIGAITIGGDLIDNDGITIEAGGQLTAPAKGLDLAIKSLTVKGSVEKAFITAGQAGNADASIGAISVGRAWLASSVQAGTAAGTDTFIGTADDTKAIGGSPRDVAGRFSTISSIIIKGQALGSTTAGDSFGIVAEQIGKARIGSRTFVFDKGERDAADAFAAAPTGPGATGLGSDFFLREIVA